MSLLFHCDLKGQAVLHPEVIKLCPSLAALTEEEVLYVILFVDYNSPYKQFPEHERRRKAMDHAFNNNNIDIVTSPRITAACEDYMSLQYNPKLETAKIYQQKIDKFQQQLLLDEAPSSTKKIGDAIDDLTRRIQALQKDYDTEMEKQGVIKGKMQLSWLEKVMSNRNHFLSLTLTKK